MQHRLGRALGYHLVAALQQPQQVRHSPQRGNGLHVMYMIASAEIKMQESEATACMSHTTLLPRCIYCCAQPLRSQGTSLSEESLRCTLTATTVSSGTFEQVAYPRADLHHGIRSLHAFYLQSKWKTWMQSSHNHLLIGRILGS